MAQHHKLVDQQAIGDVADIKDATPRQRTILIITIILLLLSLVLLSLRIVKYAQEDDREVALKTNSDAQIHLFSVYYRNADGEVIIQSKNEDKIVAPGSEASYVIRLRNNDEFAIDYMIDPHIATVGTRESIPMLVRMRDANGNYVLGTADEWVPISQLKRFTYAGTLLKTEATEFVFEWMWPYESGNDELDTSLGSGASDVGIELSFAFHSVANLSLELNGGVDNPDIAKMLGLGLAVAILLIAAIILILNAIKKRQAALVGEGDGEYMPSPENEEGGRAVNNDTLSVSLEMLAVNFSGGAVINLTTLKRRGLVPITTKRIHIVASPNFHLSKAFMVFAHSVSPDARRIIMSAGGTVFGARR